MVSPTVICLAALLVCTTMATQVEVCITNCGQCKQMFGQYFHGQACAEVCVATSGKAAPDCNNPNTIRSFLKRLF